MADSMPIKPDPEDMKMEDGSPMAVDDDPYEELDLEFYNTTDGNGMPTPQDSLLMARVPTYVWAAWDKIDDDTPIEIGKLRMWSEPDKKHPQQKMRLLLKTNVPAHQGLPREYDLVDTDQSVKNTFVFTESDLEAFKNKNKARREAADQNIPTYLLRPKVEKPPQQNHRGGRRGARKDTFRQTAVYGRVRQEYNMNPIDNPETAYLMAVRAQEQIQPKNTTQIIDRLTVTNNVVQAGTRQATEAFGTFIKETKKKTKQAKADAKTARIPENELLDRIFQCFGQYNYWSMKALKAAIPQPEVYLRSTLEKVANLNKTGRFANQWSLRDGFRANAEAAPDVAVEDEDEDDEDDVKMEDV
ncbi:hypothetical protein M406DRAFT_221321, partial [Cryphonectria parasitica EP155]